MNNVPSALYLRTLLKWQLFILVCVPWRSFEIDIYPQMRAERWHGPRVVWEDGPWGSRFWSESCSMVGKQAWTEAGAACSYTRSCAKKTPTQSQLRQRGKDQEKIQAHFAVGRAETRWLGQCAVPKPSLPAPCAAVSVGSLS